MIFSLHLLTVNEVVEDTGHWQFMRPAIPRSDELETLDEQIGCDFDLSFFIDRKEHLLWVDLPSTQPYLNTIVVVSKLIHDGWRILVNLPLSIHNILILVNPWAQSQAYSKKYLSVFTHFSIQPIYCLPLLPAALDQHLFRSLFGRRLPYKTGLFGGTWSVVKVSTLPAYPRH